MKRLLCNLMFSVAFWTMSPSTFEARCRRYDVGYGFRWFGIDWFKPHD